MPGNGSGDRPRVLLVGAGHTHALVLEQWAETQPEGVELVVVTDRPRLVYTGMIPGIVAGEYGVEEAVIDAEALARRAAARFVVGRVVRLDADRLRARLADGTILSYDVASLDVGSTVNGLDGSSAPPKGTVSARRIDVLLARLGMLESRQSEPSVVVVGGGAAGVEIAAAVRARLGRRFSFSAEAGGAVTDGAGAARAVVTSGSAGASVTVVEGAARVMDGHPEGVPRRVHRALGDRGISVRTSATVRAVERVAAEETDGHSGAHAVREARGNDPDDATAPEDPVTVVLSSGERLLSDLTVWATGAAAPPLPRDSGLPVDDEGFLLVDEDLRVPGYDTLFAVGDCASFEGRALPKAGVHAVRQAPVLFDNLVKTSQSLGRGDLRRVPDTRSSHGRSPPDDLARYEPQSDFLTLLNLGDGTALGTKWGFVVEGRWVRWLKDIIDRRFVERFRS